MGDEVAAPGLDSLRKGMGQISGGKVIAGQQPPGYGIRPPQNARPRGGSGMQVSCLLHSLRPLVDRCEIQEAGLTGALA